MLLNSFYTLTAITQAPDGFRATIVIDPEHDIFKGHFPGQPVVPGVCMLQIVKELLEQSTGRSLYFTKGNQLKFLRLLVPAADAAIQVSVSWKQEADHYTAQADFKNDTDAIFKLSGTFTAAQQVS